MAENKIVSTLNRESLSLHEQTRTYDSIDEMHGYRNFQNIRQTHTDPPNNSNNSTSTHEEGRLHEYFFVISSIVMCLNAGITYVADFYNQIKFTMGYPEILMKQFTTLGVASAASVGFVLDGILDRLSLKTSVIATSALHSLSYLLFAGLISITDANKMTGVSFYFVTTLVLVMWGVINFLAGANFFLSIKTVRTYTKESFKSTVLGVLSCAFSMSIFFISLIHDSFNNNLGLFFVVLSVVSLISILVHFFSHQRPQWNIQHEREELEELEHNKQKEKTKDLNQNDNQEENTKNKSPLTVNSNNVQDRPTNNTSSKELHTLSFYDELKTFKAIVCVLTVFFCVGIIKNIYFVMREMSVYILKISSKNKVGSPEFLDEAKQFVARNGKIISLSGAAFRLVGGIILDYMYSKQWVSSPIPMVIFFLMLLFGASLFAAISPYWAIRTTVLQCAYGFSGGWYGILPVVIGVVVSAEKFNKMLGFSTFLSTFGMLLFANLTTIINAVVGTSHTLQLYFGLCCLSMGVMGILNYYTIKSVNKDLLKSWK
eukprot:GAHX01001879.1.p1 GENE.GAHX01001879.1~~GAHX01001879.1.p1  ORF type:complete len:543 (+),score=64.03 GAHX01001879.1:51-1679(+)